MHVASRCSRLVLAGSRSPQEVWNAPRNPRICACGQPQHIQMDEGRKWEGAVRTGLRLARRIQFQLEGVGARPRILEHRNGLARGIRYRGVADGPVPGKQIPAELQWRLNALMPGGWYSAHQAACFGRGGSFRGGGIADEDLLFPQDASRSGQFAQRWKLCMMAQEAALRGAPTASYGG